MKHEIIQTKDYLLILSDEKIKEGDYMTRNCDNPILVTPDFWWDFGVPYKKIIAHLPLNGALYLEGVDVLPPLEDDVDILLKIEQEDAYKNGKGTISWYELDKRKEYYNKAKETYKYTEEDLRKAWNAAYIDALALDEETYKPLFFEDFIQSLQQSKLPAAFECEENIFFATNAFSSDITLTSKGLQETLLRSPKTITNPQGRTEWVGKYIY